MLYEVITGFVFKQQAKPSALLHPAMAGNTVFVQNWLHLSVVVNALPGDEDPDQE